MNILEQITESVLKGNSKGINLYVKEALDQKIEGETILQESLLGGMEMVGERMKNGTLFIPEVILSARAMKIGLEILKPVLNNHKIKKMGVVAIGTVKGDLHDIGKNLVSMMLESVGFETIDLGIDVSREKFIQTVREKKPDILGLSALLTATMPTMAEIIHDLKESGERNSVKVIVGGAPVTEQFSKEIGADGYARDAATAADKVKELLNIRGR